MKFITAMAILFAVLLSTTTADARYHRHHHYYHRSYHSYANAGEVVAHPSGCSHRQFCGCGVSVKVFGKPIRSLFLARAWYRFKRAVASSGMVAIFGNHHVAYIQSVYGDGTAEVYDPNSGGHQTRVHRRSIVNATIVDPRG